MNFAILVGVLLYDRMHILVRKDYDIKQWLVLFQRNLVDCLQNGKSSYIQNIVSRAGLVEELKVDNLYVFYHDNERQTKG